MRRSGGFTIVELLIVVVVIAILAAITIVSYNGIQEQTANAKIMSDLKSMQKLVESYKAVHGSYPATPSGGWSYSFYNPSDFIPDVATEFGTALPQLTKGSLSINNSYVYRSNGTEYKLIRLGQPSLPTSERDKIPISMQDGYAGVDRYGYWSPGAGGL